MANKKKRKMIEAPDVKIEIALSEDSGEVQIIGAQEDVVAIFTHALAKSKALRDMVSDSLLVLTAMHMEAHGIDFKKVFTEALKQHEKQFGTDFSGYKKKAPQHHEKTDKQPKKHHYHDPRKPRRVD